MKSPMIRLLSFLTLIVFSTCFHQQKVFPLKISMTCRANPLTMCDTKSSKSIPLRSQMKNMNIHSIKNLKYVGVGLAACLSFGKKAVAKVSSTASNGWDLYGRVPFDDFLFTNWKLTDPNLLKRSYVECITDEIGLVLGNYQRTKRLFEFKMIGQGLIAAAILLACFSAVWRFSQELGRRKKLREDKLRGFSIPLSAIRKGSRPMGKQIDGMDKGWIDMEQYEEDNNDTSSSSSGESTDGKNNKNKGGKKNKKKDDDDDKDNKDGGGDGDNYQDE